MSLFKEYNEKIISRIKKVEKQQRMFCKTYGNVQITSMKKSCYYIMLENLLGLKYLT